MGLEIGRLTKLPLGYVGEGGTRQIKIDLTAWTKAFVGATIVIYALRPDKYPYFPAFEMQDGILTWTVAKEETEVPGKGWAQIAAIDKETGDEYLSRVVQTEVFQSIDEFQTETAGDPAQGWVQQVLTARDEAVAAAKRAESAVGSGGGGGTGVTVPSYWLTHLENRAADIREAMGNAGWNKSAFLFYSDAHWSYNYGSSPAVLKWLYQHTNINKTIFGGDIVAAEGDDAETMSYLWDWRNQLRALPNHHSVPGNHDDGNSTDNRWEDAYIYSFLLAAEETADVVRGDALYYYIDVPAEKTRYLYLDTATKDGNIVNDSAQEAWLKKSLVSTPDGWHIVAVAHIWRVYDSDYMDNGWSLGAQVCLDEFDAYNDRTGDYSSCTGKVEFCIGGHTHKDADHVSDGGIPVILVECDSRNVRSGLSCTSGTITENSVNAVIADYLNGTISVIRVGRGNSRIVKLDGTGSEEVPDDEEEETGPDIPTGNFTNVLKEAGWQDNMRFSLTSHTDVTANGWDITGYIPVTLGDTIYMANVTFMDINGETTGDPRAMMVFFDMNKNFLTNSEAYTPVNLPNDKWAPVYGDNGDLTQFIVPTNYSSSVAYMRIVAHDISKYSVITVNEPIYADTVKSDYDMVAPTGNFTNMLDIAVESDGVTPYNGGHGYKNDVRYSNSSFGEKAATGWDLSGYIPAKVGDVLRFHGLEFMDMNDTGGDDKRTGITLFASDRSYVNASDNYTPTNLPSEKWSHALGDNGDIVQMTIPTSYGSSVAYIRVCAKNITGASIITVNEEIDV